MSEKGSELEPKKRRSFLSFWIHGVKKAAKKSLEHYGWTLLIFGIIYTVAAVIVSKRFREETFGGLDMSFWMTYAIPGALLLLFLIWQLARAPYEIYKETWDKFEKELFEKDKRISELGLEIESLNQKLAEKSEADKQVVIKQYAKELFGNHLTNLRFRQNEVRGISGYSYDSAMEKSETDKTYSLTNKISESLYKYLSPAEAEMFNGAKVASAGPEPYADFDRRRWERQRHVNWLDAKYEELKRIIDKLP